MSRIMPTPKVTIFIGSPRKNSNTSILAGEAERALHDAGVATEIVFFYDLQIRDCQACHGCKQDNNKICVIRDDMQGIYALMDESAGCIIAAPVYFGSVPAVTKAWLDRLVPYIGRDMSPKLSSEKTISFIFTQNMPDPALFEAPLKSFMDGTAMTGLTIRDFLIAPDLEMGQKPMATERPDLMERAYALGHNLLEQTCITGEN